MAFRRPVVSPVFRTGHTMSGFQPVEPSRVRSGVIIRATYSGGLKAEYLLLTVYLTGLFSDAGDSRPADFCSRTVEAEPRAEI